MDEIPKPTILVNSLDGCFPLRDDGTLKPGDRQVIKCYYTAGKLDSTSYSFADESYEIKDEGSYKAKDWFVSEKKSNRSGDTEFSSFQSELPSTRTYA